MHRQRAAGDVLGALGTILLMGVEVFPGATPRVDRPFPADFRLEVIRKSYVDYLLTMLFFLWSPLIVSTESLTASNIGSK